MSAPMPQPLESLRRQLEGRWERIEQARERYTWLTRQLSSFQWRSALRSQPALLKETREQEAELAEVLTYVEHRASQEQWPKQHPGLRVLQELRALRAELEALSHKRLARTPSRDGASLVEALGELEALALAPLPRPPGAGDPVLFEDGMLSWPSPGRVWLTPKRLFWRPRFGEPEQQLLAPLEPDAITLLPGWIGVHVKRMGLSLFSLSARTLASLLQLGLRTAHLWHEQPQVRDVVTSLAYVRHADHVAPERWGLAVFGPDGVALLPASHPTLLDLCRSLVGIDARRPQHSELRRLEVLVEHLRLLPPDEFNHALWELALARGGKFWPSTGLYRLTPSEREVKLQAGKHLLVVAAGKDAVRQLLMRHPSTGSSHPKLSWWRKHRDKVGIVAGLVIFYTAGLWLQSGQPLSLAGYALFTWASMRYSKAKGYSTLPGLVCAIIFPLFTCMPLGLFLLGISARDEPRLHENTPRV